MTTGIRFAKGHGTENDFVLLPDPDDRLELSGPLVRALCDRRAGIGGDGVLRLVRAAPDAWFMDYRNADGSVAEMCGNGVRVFARYLVATGMERRSEFTVRSRAGDRPVVVHADGSVTVDMGPPRVGTSSVATLGGAGYPGVAVDVGNPHLVCLTGTPVAELDLHAAPGYDAALFPDGVNVEFVNRCGDASVRMRVYERGSGETRSCGTGTVASAAALLHADGVAEGTVRVEVPGGTVRVHVGAGTSTLTGPAVLVGAGELDPAWWAGAIGAGPGMVGGAGEPNPTWSAGLG